MDEICPDCGATHLTGGSCQDAFHQMLFWENEEPARGVVHHLMVLCYHLQHPALYSAEGLAAARQLLDDFVASGLDPQQARRKNQARVASDRRDWSISARPGNKVVYERPVQWAMTTADLIAGGAEDYVANVHAWATSVQQDIRALAIDR